MAAHAAARAAEPREATQSKPHASPSVRKFARELGVDLARVQGQRAEGPHPARRRAGLREGRAGRQRRRAAPAAKGGALPFNLPAWPEVDFAKFGPVEAKPLSRIRSSPAPNLHRNWVSIPHVTQFDEADITDLEAFRKTQHRGDREAGLQADDARVPDQGLRHGAAAVPELQRLARQVGREPGGEEVLPHRRRGRHARAAWWCRWCATPTARACSTSRASSAEISKLARDKKLKPGDMQGGTFSISSLGGIGGTAFTPIINAPEVAILGVSRSAMRPVVERQGSSCRA